MDNSARLLRSRAKARHHRPMDVAWTVGVLPAGVENVQVLAAGVGGRIELPRSTWHPALSSWPQPIAAARSTECPWPAPS